MWVNNYLIGREVCEKEIKEGWGGKLNRAKSLMYFGKRGEERDRVYLLKGKFMRRNRITELPGLLVGTCNRGINDGRAGRR